MVVGSLMKSCDIFGEDCVWLISKFAIKVSVTVRGVGMFMRLLEKSCKV